jgi:hypothetical protein
MRRLLPALFALGLFAAAHAQPGRPLDDAQLEQISGRDGIGFAMHLALNDPAISDVERDSRLSLGFRVDGRDTYLVIRNLAGTIDLFSLNLSVRKKPDGGDYLALDLPGHLKFTNFGFDSLSVQTDPLAPVSGDLGRFNLNGTLSMQGQLRLWAH